MYQGKFSKKRTSPAPKPLPEQEPTVTELSEALPEPETAVAEQSVVLPEAAMAGQPEALPEPEVSSPRRGPRTSTLIFYTSYVMLILLFTVGMFFTLNSIEQKLIDFEASQPDPKSDAVFAELFETPDWAALYDLAGIQDTVFEGRDAFAAYMEQATGGQSLSYQATSAGLSGARKYLVKLGSNTIGSFTLVCDPEAAVPEWELGTVELSHAYAYTQSIRVRKLSGHTVYVNGVALDDSYTTHIGSTTADEYLPRGVYNVWIHTQQVDGLMVTPTVTATNEMGEDVAVLYDSATKTYITADPTNTCTPEEQELAMSTVKAYVQYLLERIPKKELKLYFDPESQLYERILGEEVWMLTNVDPQFENEAVTAFYRYSDDIYSIRVILSAYVTRVNGTQKEYLVEKTLIFQRNEDDAWVCVDMIDQDLSQLDQSVRITFQNGDTTLSTEFYDADLRELTTPLLSNDDGHTVTGWYREETDGNGIVHRILVFTPDIDGNVTLPEGTRLEPMTLYAQFDDIPTEK